MSRRKQAWGKRERERKRKRKQHLFDVDIHTLFPIAIALPQADALEAQQFNASIDQLKAQYDEELARLLSIFNSIQESKSTRIDELKAEIANMQDALGIT